MKIAVKSLFLLLVVGSTLTAQEPIEPGKEHAFLAGSEGEWTVSMPAEEGDSKGTCKYKMAHNGLWLTSHLDMKLPSGPFTGQGLDTFDPKKKKFITVWIDSMSTTPLVFEGVKSSDGKKITMTGKGPAPDGSSADYKTETEYVSKDKHVFKLWIGTTTGDPMMTLTYDRKK